MQSDCTQQIGDVVRFRILGPLDVEDGGNPVAVGGPKPRTLLAALLVNRGTVVTADRLVDAVWPQDAPPGAVSALRAYVSRLRTALGPPERLSYRAPGYLLSVDDDELDATHFEQRVAEARSAVEGGDHRRALDVLDIALSLWHGDALAEFAHLDFAAGEAARLEELRIAATEDRADALLHCERSSQAVAELEALVRRFPLRERPVALLMRALYGSGRQGDEEGSQSLCGLILHPGQVMLRSRLQRGERLVRSTHRQDQDEIRRRRGARAA